MGNEKSRMAWYQAVPTNLLQVAYKSTSELAWPKEQALQVIAAAEAGGYRITSVEPWLPTSPGPTQLGYDWAIERTQGSTHLPPDAATFIQHFDVLFPSPEILSESPEPVFNISAE